MPQLQVVNTTRDKPDPTGVSEFFSRLGKDYKDREDQLEIGNLLSQYQQNREQANAWEDLQLGLQKSNIGPSKRLQAQEELNAIRKNVIEKDKVLNAQTKILEADARKKSIEEEKKAKELKDQEESLDKSIKTQNEVREILLSGGEDEDEAERLSKILSPSSANSRVKEKNAVSKIKSVKEEKEEKEEESKKVTQEAFNDIAKLVNKAGRGTGFLSMFGGENARTLGEFTSLTGALESLLVEKVNRGALSNTRFKYITETLLPKPTDPQNKIKGKLKGLATILGLDATELEKLDQKKSKEKLSKPNVPKGKVRVMIKGSNPPQYGSVTPYPGMESKYDVIE